MLRRRTTTPATPTPSARDPRENPDGLPHVTIRSIVVGLLVGSLLCFTNMYFGLQTGWISMMSLQSALVGFALFKAVPARFMTQVFGPVEHSVLTATAVATGTMPLAAGFVGIIPALGLLEEAEGRVVLSTGQLIFWGMGIAFFGVFFAVPLRRQVIIKEKLKFPSGMATAQMIAVLHNRPDPTTEDDEDTSDLGRLLVEDNHLTEEERLQAAFAAQTDTPVLTWSAKLRALVISFAVSSIYTLLSHFFPVLNALPLLDWATNAAIPFAAWNWYLTPALSYVGQGAIMGLPTTLAMLLGAIVGWGILGPISQQRGWAPGAVNDQKRGPRGWILWVSLAIMISESLIGLGVVTAKELIRRWAERKARRSQKLSDDAVPIVQETADYDATLPPGWLVPDSWTYTGLAVSSIFCAIASSIIFGVPWYASVVAVVMACLLSVLAVRALGETDMNPVSGIGKVSQFVFAGVVPGGLVANLVAGGISEAGAQQAGDMMQDLKTGHLLRASPRAQFLGQLIGSFFSVLISVGTYQLFTSVYKIPGPQFQVPTAFVWLDMARLVNGHALPANTAPFILAFAVLFAIPPILELALPKSWWVRRLPSGVAFAIGMLITPNYTIPRVLGALAGDLVVRLSKEKSPLAIRNRKVIVIVVASGLVLGEGTFALVSMVLKSVGIGAVSCAGCLPGLCGECA